MQKLGKSLKIRNTVKVIGVIFLATGFYNTLLNIVAIFYRARQFFFSQMNLHNGSEVSFLFILNLVFYLLLMMSGFGLVKLKRVGVWMLYLAVMVFIVEGIVVGVYQETFNMLMSPTYTWIGKGLILVYFYYTKLLMPTLVLIFFRHPKVVSIFEK